MSKYGLVISKSNRDVEKAPFRHQSFHSDANQWKIHRAVTIYFTAANQTKTLAHGLGYTPAYIAFQKSSANAYFHWASVNDYVDSEKITTLSNNGDIRSFIFFKDFGR